MSNNDAGSASLTAGSKASGEESKAVMQARNSHAASQFRDDSNLQKAMRFLTTLEEKDDQDDSSETLALDQVIAKYN